MNQTLSKLEAAFNSQEMDINVSYDEWTDLMHYPEFFNNFEPVQDNKLRLDGYLGSYKKTLILICNQFRIRNNSLN